MKATSWNRPSTADDVRREEQLYDEMMRTAPTDCYVVLPGELIHAPEPEALLSILAERGIGREDVFIVRASGPEGHLAHDHVRLT